MPAVIAKQMTKTSSRFIASVLGHRGQTPMPRPSVPALLRRFGSSDVSAASDDLTFHGFLNIGASGACRNVEHRVECIDLEDVVMVWMARRRRRSHVLRTAQTVLIRAGRNRTAFRDRR